MMEGMSAPEIVEVGPRDGLQNEDVVLDVAPGDEAAAVLGMQSCPERAITLVDDEGRAL